MRLEHLGNLLALRCFRSVPSIAIVGCRSAQFAHLAIWQFESTSPSPFPVSIVAIRWHINPPATRRALDRGQYHGGGTPYTRGGDSGHPPLPTPTLAPRGLRRRGPPPPPPPP